MRQMTKNNNATYTIRAQRVFDFIKSQYPEHIITQADKSNAAINCAVHGETKLYLIKYTKGQDPCILCQRDKLSVYKINLRLDELIIEHNIPAVPDLKSGLSVQKWEPTQEELIKAKEEFFKNGGKATVLPFFFPAQYCADLEEDIYDYHL